MHMHTHEHECAVNTHTHTSRFKKGETSLKKNTAKDAKWKEDILKCHTRNEAHGRVAVTWGAPDCQVLFSLLGSFLFLVTTLGKTW